MREKELREHAECDYCGEAIGEAMNERGVPGFHVIECKTYSLDLAACQRQNGLGQMIGGALAMAMGGEGDLANEVYSEKSTMCMNCLSLLPEQRSENHVEN